MNYVSTRDKSRFITKPPFDLKWFALVSLYLLDVNFPIRFPKFSLTFIEHPLYNLIEQKFPKRWEKKGVHM